MPNEIRILDSNLVKGHEIGENIKLTINVSIGSATYHGSRNGMMNNIAKFRTTITV